MRFSITAAASLSMISMVLALPYNSQIQERGIAKEDTFSVKSDVGTVKVTLPKLTVREIESVPEADAQEETEEETEDEALAAPLLEARAASPKAPAIGDVGTAVAIANGIIDIGNKIDKIVGGIIQGDIDRRKQFTQRIVADLRQRFGSTNFVISNVGYKFTGHMISKKQVFYHNHIGAKVSFDVIAFKKGTFQLEGDGGFQNWAAIYDSRCTHRSKFIQC